MLASLTGRRVAMMLAATQAGRRRDESTARGARHDASAAARRRRGSQPPGDSRRGGRDPRRTPRLVRNRRAAHRAVRAESARWRRRAVWSMKTRRCCVRPPLAAGIAGPFPADTVFVRAMRGAFDAVIAPYHDVGMTAIKVASFGVGGECHAGVAVSALLAGSRNGAGHRGAGNRRRVEHDRIDRVVRADRAAAGERVGLSPASHREPAIAVHRWAVCQS